MNQNLLRRLSLLFAFVAVTYAALAAMRTVGDFDMGWHLATGRYLFQHLAIPSTDVLSYTSAGAPWIYPCFAGAILYAVFHGFGYAGLTWFCVLTATLLAGYLLWRAVPTGSLAMATLLVLAVPSLAHRLTPRADLFTTLFFAIILVELWRFHRGESARLWLLPPVMFLWVNLHPGFIAGLGVIAAYLLMEVLLLPFGNLRPEVLLRLAKSWPWIAAGAAVTLLNPWGAGAMRQALALARVAGGSQQTPRFIGEFSSAPLSWRMVSQALLLRDPDSSFWWLLAISAAAVLLALRRRQFGAALLLSVAMVAAIERLRYQGLFAILVTVIAGTLLTEAFANMAAYLRPKLKGADILTWSAVALVTAMCGLAALRMTDLSSNRYYIVSASTSSFGPGESWWFPERAAEFIEREKLPGNIFQPYNLGGWTALRLGPTYPDYIDGRGVSQEVSDEEQLLLSQSPDSAAWQQVAARRNINIILLSLARYGGLGGFDLPSYCAASTWRPVYIDEVSLVLLRRTPQNQPWLDRLGIDCQTAQIALPTHPSKIESYNFLSNSGAVYYSLARDGEAEAAWLRAAAINPEDPNIHLSLAQLYLGDPVKAEHEYQAALARKDSAPAWYALGRLLAGQHRYAEAEQAIANSIPLTPTPANQYKALAQVQLRLQKTTQAQASLLQAERAGPSRDDSGPSAREFRAQIADGRAEVARQSGKLPLAVEFAHESTRQTPQSASRWKKLAELASTANQTNVAIEAARRAQELEVVGPH